MKIEIALIAVLLSFALGATSGCISGDNEHPPGDVDAGELDAGPDADLRTVAGTWRITFVRGAKCAMGEDPRMSIRFAISDPPPLLEVLWPPREIESPSIVIMDPGHAKVSWIEHVAQTGFTVYLEAGAATATVTYERYLGEEYYCAATDEAAEVEYTP